MVNRKIHDSSPPGPQLPQFMPAHTHKAPISPTHKEGWAPGPSGAVCPLPLPHLPQSTSARTMSPKLPPPTSPMTTYRLSNPMGNFQPLFFLISQENIMLLITSLFEKSIFSWVSKDLTLNLLFLSISFVVSTPSAF
jgi:hypothetical protein